MIQCTHIIYQLLNIKVEQAANIIIIKHSSDAVMLGIAKCRNSSSSSSTTASSQAPTLTE
jgi:hypothetical protein